MDHYIDIRLRPDPEFPANTLMNALFSKLHKGLVSHGQGNIGVSFPEAKDNRALGRHLRLHGTAEVLVGFIARDWLSGIRDHVSISTAAPVPPDAAYRTVRRVQAKSNPARDRRRLIARKGISEAAARLAIPDHAAERLNLPFVVLNSRTTGQQFRLFIEHLPLQNQSQPGCFGAYGLSASATIPWF